MNIAFFVGRSICKESEKVQGINLIPLTEFFLIFVSCIQPFSQPVGKIQLQGQIPHQPNRKPCHAAESDQNKTAANFRKLTAVNLRSVNDRTCLSR